MSQRAVSRIDTPAGAYKQPIPGETLIAAGDKMRIRINADGTFTVAGLNPETFFSPGQPMLPQAQAPRMGAVGRRFDYQPLVNTNYTPRGNQLVSFNDLRALARNYDVLRSVIETRKDQFVALDWKLDYRDAGKAEDDKLRKLNALFQFPDGRRPYVTWARALLEEVFVTDALCIYPQFTNDGSFHAFRWMDGTKIKPVIDESGDLPDPPSPAYQQILRGMPAVDYTSDELVYWPRNQSVDSVYGYPQVEQIIVTVNIALRRQIFQLDYYRQGSVPDALVGVPDNWTPEQILVIQDHWDSMFNSPGWENIGERRKLKFVPGANKVTFSKEAALKDEFDEWLARVVCYCFSVEPTPFIKQMNRGTAETQKEQSREEGLLPLKKFWKALVDYLLVKYLNAGDVHFVWDEETEIDPKVASDIAVQEVREGIITADEVRADRGKEPLPQKIETDPRMLTTEQLDGQQPPAAGGGGAGGAPAKPAPPAESPKAEKLAKAVRPERRTVMIQRQRLTRAVKRQLRAQALAVKTSVGPHLGKAKTAEELAGAIDWSVLKDFPGAVRDPLKRVSADAVEHSKTHLQKDAASSGIAIQPGFIDQYAADYASERGAEMVGMRYDDEGNLVENPDAQWAITDETRAGVRDLLQESIDQGWSLDQFSDALADSYAFSAERAGVIARTETRLADSKGQLAGWKDSGLVAQKVWLVSNDGCCDECQGNADEGPIDVEDDFPSGDDSAPAHPNCQCVIAPIVAGEEE